jgi:hypothetical protein
MLYHRGIVFSRLARRERQVLLALLAVRTERSVLDETGLDWAALVQAAERGKLLPMLAQRASVEGARVPDAALQARLRDALLESAVYKTRLFAELARAVGVLDAAGIGHVVLKGAALLLRHYPAGQVRHTVDLDLLVDPARFAEAVQRLEAAGYTLAPHAHRRMPDGRSYAEASSARPHAHAPLKGPSGVNVDLHHRVPVSGYAAQGGFRGWHARAVAVELHGARLRCASPADLAVHLCEHFALQNFAEPTEAPRLLADLRALYSEAPPWAQLAEGPRAQRLAVALCRRLYEAAFATEVASPLAELWQRLAVADPAVVAVPGLVSHLRGHAHRIGSDLRYRPRYALATWLPSRAYLAERYGVDPRSPRIYALYVSRLWTAAAGPFLSRG